MYILQLPEKEVMDKFLKIQMTSFCPAKLHSKDSVIVE